MKLNLGGFEFNKYAVAIICLFILFVVMRSIYFFMGIFVDFTTQLPPPPLWAPLILETIVAGVAGLKASDLFGGRRNFTGRLLFYFSLQIFFYMAFLVYFELQSLQLVTSSFYLQLLFANSGFGLWILGIQFCFPAYALWASVRSTWNKFDSKSVVVIFLSIAFALVVGWANFVWADPAAGQTTVADTVLWVGIFPTMAFLELSSGVLLLRSLGKWYVKKSITALVLTLLINVAMLAIVTSVGFYWFAMVYNPFFASYVWFDVMGSFAAFLLCLAITQFKVRMTGPYY